LGKENTFPARAFTPGEVDEETTAENSGGECELDLGEKTVRNGFL